MLWIRPSEMGGHDEREAASGGTDDSAATAVVPRQQAPGETFDAGERFRIDARLGEGAFGTVYRVFDRERSATVALKVLRRTGARALYRFKREFRALADVHHPNLVVLHELFAEGERWFFTMELVEGLDLVRWVEQADDGTPGSHEARHQRMREALVQLAGALETLHATGRLHRDLKPENVRVTPEGRVVVLDFGLVAELAPLMPERTGDVTGSPGYMSPEQAVGAPAGAASDWYAVGVMLFEALTGRLPFGGPPAKVLVDKQTLEAPSVRERAPSAPDDLVQLCQELLARTPEARPDGAEVARRLEQAGSERASDIHTVPPPRDSRPPFVGRTAELERLQDAFEASRAGRTVVVRMRGDSGMGKSALLRRFLESARGRRTVVLDGRCYEQESVPYQGFDSIVDALSRYLATQREPEARALLPDDVAMLAHLFPVLEQVPAVAEAVSRGFAVPDPQQLRRRAFATFRDLLQRIGRRRRLVLALDDAQWGDRDSAALMAEVLRAPDPPSMLLIACYRDEDRDRALPALLEELSFGREAAAEVRNVDVAQLPEEDLTALARKLIVAAGPQTEERATLVAREARGSPLFAAELARWAELGAETGSVTLGEALGARIDRLPADERALLETVCVAGRPLERGVAREAGTAGGDEPRLVAALRGAQLLRLRREPSGGVALEPHHDRIRETVVARLPKERRAALHARLAEALLTGGEADAEVLAVHLEGAGERPRAAERMTAAADEAFDALAWDRAARLYRRALVLYGAGSGDVRRLRVRLGDALANAGRGAEAAEVYRAAAAAFPHGEALDLRRRAAEQLLRCGRIEEGYAAIGQVLREVGLRLPPTPRRAIASLLLDRARLRLRGLGFRERSEAELSAADLRRIDVCWSAGVGLGAVDSFRGAGFLARSLLLSLEAGEPYRIARSLAFEAAYNSNLGGPAEARVDELLRRCEAMAERLDVPHLHGLAAAAGAVAGLHMGRYRESVAKAERAERIFREQCVGVVKEIVTVQVFGFAALVQLGRFDELASLVPRYVLEAEQRGDLYSLANLRSGMPNGVWLAADDPRRARREASEAMRPWTPRGFLLQHYFDVYAHAQIDMYEDDGAGALARFDEAWPALGRSMLLRLQMVRVLSWGSCGRAALIAAAARGGRARAALIARAEREASRIAAEERAWCRPQADLLRAGAAILRGQDRGVDERLAAAAAGFRAADMAAYAEVARRLRGEHLGGEEGRVLRERADASLRELGVRHPGRFARMLAGVGSAV